MKRKIAVLFLILAFSISSIIGIVSANVKPATSVDKKIDPIIYLDYAGDEMLNYDYMVDMVDSDGDGLSDYEEIYKYLTDPNNPDTDGDGIPDGDWNERREYTYSIRVIRELDKPFNSASLKDTYQDIRIIEETEDKLIYEAILYPYAIDKVKGNPNWKEYKDDPRFEELLKPRKTTNWDSQMQEQILKSIPREAKTDLEVAQYLVNYYFKYRKKNPIPIKNGVNPVDFYVDLRYEEPLINMYDEFKNGKRNPNISDEKFINQILFAKGIFEDRVDGACTSDATYMVAIFRAAGIPARIIETNSLLDYRYKEQIKLTDNLKNESIKKLVKEQRPSYYGHYYFEAYIGGRWIKINNNGRLFESMYIEDYPGIFHVKADTFFDYADTGMSDIWKNGYPKKLPYKLLRISDEYGVHYDGKIHNNPVVKEPEISLFDVSQEEIIDYVVKKGVLKGTNKGLELEKELTRAEGAVMLVRLLGKENVLSARNSHPFTDVPEWASPYVAYLYENGLTNGLSSTSYGSNDSLSANQFMTFALRTLGFKDSWGEFKWDESVRFAKDEGIITSKEKTQLDDRFNRYGASLISYRAIKAKEFLPNYVD